MSFSIASQLEKVLYQYTDSENLLNLLRASIYDVDLIITTLNALRTRLDIDLSAGIQLDGIGEIVGRERPLTEDAVPDNIFTFAGGVGLGFSGIGRPDVGGYFGGFGIEYKTPMRDPDYRILLKATIFANYATSTVDNIAQYILFVLGDYPRLYNHTGYIDLTFPRALSTIELSIIDDFLPVAAGIGRRYLAYTLGSGGFGFAGHSDNTGFGGVGIAQTGSGFAGLILTGG